MDILLQDNGDGAEVVLTGGDLQGDGTLYNAVYLSLFGGDNFSNVYEEYESDGEFEESLNLPVTAPNLKIVKAAANKSLKWMIDEGIADSVDCFAYGGQSGKIEIEIKIQETAGNNQTFALIWENQKRILCSMKR